MRVVVLGATGSVGRAILRLLEERTFVRVGIDVVALASPASAGKKVSMGDAHVLTTQRADTFVFQEDDWVFSAVSESVARDILPKAQKAGARIIDKSSAFRREVPLVVPEVNGHMLTADVRFVASPNCVAIPLALALAPLSEVFEMKRAVVSTYQAVSGAGKRGLDTLYAETRTVMMTQAPHTEKSPFGAQIAFNAVPWIGDMDAQGISGEEEKIQTETAMLLGRDVPIQATAVRLPIFVGHGMAVVADFEESVTASKAGAMLRKAPGLMMPRACPTVMDGAGEETVQVGRVRALGDKTLAFWLASDNLLKGAALNAVQIAEAMRESATS